MPRMPAGRGSTPTAPRFEWRSKGVAQISSKSEPNLGWIARRVMDLGRSKIDGLKPGRMAFVSGRSKRVFSWLSGRSKGIIVTTAATDLCFESFLPGEENAPALEACNKVLECPGAKYNPLVLFGPPSVGKTHLMYALRRSMEEFFPAWNILSLPAGEFMEECELNWENKTSHEFRQQLWRLDALLIDDIHVLERSEPSKEELYHTFNRFVADGRQLVFTSRESPADLLKMSLALRQRLQSGLVIHIDPPREQLLRDLFSKECERTGVRPSQKAAGFLIREARSARDLRGIFQELLLHVGPQPVSLEEVRTILQKHTAKSLSIADVAQKVCDYFRVDVQRVRSASRQQSLVQARQMAMYLVREMTATPLTQIGRYFGNRDHTTVMYACRKVADDVKKDHFLSQACRDIRAQLRG